MRRVSSGGQYSCDDCPRSFARRGDLTRHANIHCDTKPYNCKFCRKGFSQSSGLKTHMNVHTGDKPYVCSFDCNSTFGDPSSCARHEKEIHRRIIPYRCPHPYCSSRIKRRSSFADHLKSKHGIDADVVDIDSFAPPLLPALPNRRKPRRNSLDLVTETAAMEEHEEQSIPSSVVSPSCSEPDTPSPVDDMSRSYTSDSSTFEGIQVPHYADVFDGLNTKPFCPLSMDSTVDFPIPEQYIHNPVCVPPFYFFTGVKTEPYQTPWMGPIHRELVYSTRDVALDLDTLPYSFRGRIDCSLSGSTKSWS